MADMQFISDFLARVEGARQTRGYIPAYRPDGKSANYHGGCAPQGWRAMGASGVTIATGCDLGQTTAAALRSYGLAEDVIALYSFYYGKRRGDALEALWRKPLEISARAARLTDRAVHQGYLDRNVRPAFEKASALKFDALPCQAQAVVMSVCFQKGCAGVRKDWPKLWGHLVAGDWLAAANELLTGFSQYRSRRETEGRLLMEAV